MPDSIADLFWARVQKGDGCWEWAGHRMVNGYGSLGKRPAHRVSWELAYGPIPAGMNVLHRCDNPPCVRPDHLFLGTQKDNLRDAVEKGRHRTNPSVGEDNHHHKLTAEAVREARELRAQGWLYPALAKRYGVGVACINNAVRGKTWRSV